MSEHTLACDVLFFFIYRKRSLLSAAKIYSTLHFKTSYSIGLLIKDYIMCIYYFAPKLFLHILKNTLERV